MKRKKSLRLGVIVAILLITVGFAAITTTLTINATAKIAADSANFSGNIIFASVTASTDATAAITNGGKSITFTTKELKAINDNSTVTYTIKNTSNYNATVAKVSCTSEDALFATHLTTTSSRTTDLVLAKGETSDAENVIVKMIKTYPESTTKSITVTCTLTATASAA